MFRQYRDGPQGTSHRQGTDVTHENLRRVCIKPEKAQASPKQGPTEHGQFTSAPYMHKVQILGKVGVANDISDTSIDEGRNDIGPGGQSIQSISEIDRIALADDDQDANGDIPGPEIRPQLFKKGHIETHRIAARFGSEIQ